MLVVAVLVAVGLYVLGMPLVAALAVIAGLMNFIPFVGAFIGAAPAVLVGMATSPTLAIEVVALFLVVQTFEGYVTAPLIQRRTVHLPPALTIASQAILASLFGLFGLILATPVMATALTAVRLIYVESVLEHEDTPVV
ncbi:MAG TPA: AI-2E family transporter [Acetobacteraceae bacterium]|jgi:predicted PurR-regulated permease PerM|nr:AI-2E family transporter [Acetobacteraceae bacterium]